MQIASCGGGLNILILSGSGLLPLQWETETVPGVMGEGRCPPAGHPLWPSLEISRPLYLSLTFCLHLRPRPCSDSSLEAQFHRLCLSFPVDSWAF